MAKIKVNFNNKDYQIEESAFASASEKVVTHLTGEMKGAGATVNFDGTAYDVDSTKLGSSAAALAAYLGTIVGSGVKIVIGGVEYGVDAAKVVGAVTGVETTLVNLSQPPISEGLKYTSNGDGTCYVSGIGTCTDTDVVIPSVSPEGKPVTGVGSEAFYNCTSLTSITIPNSVTFISYWAFGGCSSLTSITIPDSVKTIGEGTFDSCTSLTSITIPNSVTSIGYVAFRDCTSLTSITIPNSITSIDYGTFDNCISLKSITYEGTIEQWNAIDKYVTSGRLPVWDDGTGDYTVYCTDGDITKDGEVIIPEEELPASEGLEYTSNGDGTCYVSGIGTCADTEIVIPSTEGNEQVTAIGYCAFFMSSITGVTIPDSVTSIGYQAFSVCESLTDVVIPESVTTIGEMAFENCISLKSVTIGKGIKFIDSMAFAFAESLEDMYYSGTMAEWNAIEKADDWDEPIRSEGYTIHCADGDIVRKYN